MKLAMFVHIIKIALNPRGITRENSESQLLHLSTCIVSPHTITRTSGAGGPLSWISMSFRLSGQA